MKTNYITNYNCGVYKITNLKNGKCYIGQSIQLKERFRCHRKHKDKSLFHNAIRKHGIENFHFEVLIYCDRRDLNLYENLFILTFNTRSPNGYNLDMDGSYAEPRSLETRKKMSDRLKIKHPNDRKLIDITGRTWRNVTECAKELNVRGGHLSSMLSGKRLWYKHLKLLDIHYYDEHPENYEFVQMEEIENVIPKYVKRNPLIKYDIKDLHKLGGKNPSSKKVIDKDGRIWYSASECSEELQINTRNFRQMLNGRIPMLKRIEHLELKWFSDFKFKEDKTPRYEPKRKMKNRSKNQNLNTAKKVIDRNGKIWESATECAKELGLNKDELRKYLNGKINEPKKIIGLDLKFL